MKSLEILSDHSLLAAYKKACRLNVRQDFLSILKQEINRRNLIIE